MGIGMGVKALGYGADANFFPSRLEIGQALLHEALGPGAATCLFLLNFSDWSIGIVSQSARDALGWAGKFGKLCRIVEKNNFEFWE